MKLELTALESQRDYQCGTEAQGTVKSISETFYFERHIKEPSTAQSFLFLIDDVPDKTEGVAEAVRALPNGVLDPRSTDS